MRIKLTVFTMKRFGFVVAVVAALIFGAVVLTSSPASACLGYTCG